MNVVAHRSTPSRAVLHRRGRWCSTPTISSTITGSFVKRQRKRPGRTVSSDRVVLFHLVLVVEHGHAVRTVRRVTSHRLKPASPVEIPGIPSFVSKLSPEMQLQCYLKKEEQEKELELA